MLLKVSILSAQSMLESGPTGSRFTWFVSFRLRGDLPAIYANGAGLEGTNAAVVVFEDVAGSALGRLIPSGFLGMFTSPIPYDAPARRTSVQGTTSMQEC